MSNTHEIATVLAHTEGSIALLLAVTKASRSAWSLEKEFGAAALRELRSVGLVSVGGMNIRITPIGLEMVQALKRSVEEINLREDCNLNDK